jgi:hypothetical protein
MIQDGSRKRVVLGRAGKVIFLSRETDGKKASSENFTAEELIESGFTVIDPVEEVEEITMSELCKRLGKTVKIKKE